jgi:hypothetical protein
MVLLKMNVKMRDGIPGDNRILFPSVPRDPERLYAGHKMIVADTAETVKGPLHGT